MKISKHNEDVRKELKKIEDKINSLKDEYEQVKKKLIPPCEECKYDGIYRCEACEEDNFAGCNVKEYPI